MKTSHLKTVSTYAFVAWCLIAVGLVCVRAQDATNTQPTYAPIDMSTNPPAATAAPAAPEAPATTVASTNSVAPDAAPAAAADVAAAPAAAPSAEPVAAPTAVIIPTIVMDEVPLTDAIKNLAR